MGIKQRQSDVNIRSFVFKKLRGNFVCCYLYCNTSSVSMRGNTAFGACTSAEYNCTDLVHFLLPLAVGLGVIQRPLPFLLLVGVQVRWCHPATSTVMQRRRGRGRRVRRANPGFGQTALSYTRLLHAQIQGAILIHLNVQFLERQHRIFLTWVRHNIISFPYNYSSWTKMVSSSKWT